MALPRPVGPSGDESARKRPGDEIGRHVALRSRSLFSGVPVQVRSRAKSIKMHRYQVLSSNAVVAKPFQAPKGLKSLALQEFQE